MPTSLTRSISDLVSEFADQLTRIVEEEATERARDAVLAAVGGRPSARGAAAVAIRRGPGRPPGKARKKAPIQYCPVPGCKNRAAPVFGMVCADHKNLPKAKIKKYRELRRAKKEKAKG
jgi:hypothetical protein